MAKRGSVGLESNGRDIRIISFTPWRGVTLALLSDGTLRVASLEATHGAETSYELVLREEVAITEALARADRELAAQGA